MDSVIVQDGYASEGVRMEKSSASAGVMPLSLAEGCGALHVQTIRGKDETRKFLAGLGFVEGARVSVVCKMQGDLIVEVKGTRVALGQKMAQRIMVG